MPTYQYACKDCGHRFEAVQSFSDASLTECPQCTGTLRKLFGSVGVIFKGSGFYRNDSRSDAKSGSTAASSTNGGDSKTADSSSSNSSSSSSSSSDSGKSGKSDSSSSSANSSSSSSTPTKTSAAAP
ncbi:FmdB family zinc ribbon protein [Amycolatopsis nigrescens]|uniref:FmdB family zinc ribbon protein n=1 Tax=Amycolatopsis nigrescens TaxID=381445 RepID=UPI000A067A1C|nr:FmdB family zinc ribbon protein [Amycolatopsis nigrescens]